MLNISGGGIFLKKKKKKEVELLFLCRLSDFSPLLVFFLFKVHDLRLKGRGRSLYF